MDRGTPPSVAPKKGSASYQRPRSSFWPPVKGVTSNLAFVAGGGRWQNNDVLLDGIDNNTMATSGGIGISGINYIPSVDAVAEFKVKTNNYSAEFGRSAGTIVS